MFSIEPQGIRRGGARGFSWSIMQLGPTACANPGTDFGLHQCYVGLGQKRCISGEYFRSVGDTEYPEELQKGIAAYIFA